MTDLTPRIVEIDSAVKLLGILCYSSSTLEGAVKYFTARFGKPPEVVYRWLDSKQYPQFWVALR
jgi:hypothetical protein